MVYRCGKVGFPCRAVVEPLELAGDVEEEVAQFLVRLWPVQRPQVVDDSPVWRRNFRPC